MATIGAGHRTLLRTQSRDVTSVGDLCGSPPVTSQEGQKGLWYLLEVLVMGDGILESFVEQNSHDLVQEPVLLLQRKKMAVWKGRQ